MKRVYLLVWLLGTLGMINAQAPPVKASKNSTNSMLNGKSIPEKKTSILYDEAIHKKLKIFDDYYWFFKKGSHYLRSNVGILRGNQVLLPCVFRMGSSAKGRKNAKQVLSVNKTFGVYDMLNDKWTIPLKYKLLKDYGEDVFVIGELYNGDYYIVDGLGNLLVHYPVSSFLDLDNEKLRFTKSTSQNRDMTEKLQGIYDIKKKKVQTTAQFSEILTYCFTNNFLIKNKKGRYNIMRPDGSFLFGEWYDEIDNKNCRRQDSTLFLVKKKERYGVLDFRGKTIIPIKYTNLAKSTAHNDFFIARKENGKLGFIDRDGKTILPFKFLELKYYKGEFTIGLMDKGAAILVFPMDDTSPYMIAFDYEDIVIEKGIVLIKKNGLWGVLYIYPTGNGFEHTVFIKPTYEELESIGVSKLLAKKGDKYSFIEVNGEKIMDLEFDSVLKFDEEKYIVSLGGFYGLYNLSARKYDIPPEFKRLYPIDENNLLGEKEGSYYKIRVQPKVIVHKIE